MYSYHVGGRGGRGGGEQRSVCGWRTTGKRRPLYFFGRWHKLVCGCGLLSRFAVAAVGRALLRRASGSLAARHANLTSTLSAVSLSSPHYGIRMELCFIAGLVTAEARRAAKQTWECTNCGPWSAMRRPPPTAFRRHCACVPGLYRPAAALAAWSGHPTAASRPIRPHSAAAHGAQTKAPVAGSTAAPPAAPGRAACPAAAPASLPPPPPASGGTRGPSG